jgi:hypothetical protein
VPIERPPGKSRSFHAHGETLTRDFRDYAVTR